MMFCRNTELGVASHLWNTNRSGQDAKTAMTSSKIQVASYLTSWKMNLSDRALSPAKGLTSILSFETLEQKEQITGVAGESKAVACIQHSLICQEKEVACIPTMVVGFVYSKQVYNISNTWFDENTEVPNSLCYKCAL